MLLEQDKGQFEALITLPQCEFLLQDLPLMESVAT